MAHGAYGTSSEYLSGLGRGRMAAVVYWWLWGGHVIILVVAYWRLHSWRIMRERASEKRVMIST